MNYLSAKGKTQGPENPDKRGQVAMAEIEKQDWGWGNSNSNEKETWTRQTNIITCLSLCGAHI